MYDLYREGLTSSDEKEAVRPAAGLPECQQIPEVVPVETKL